MRLLCLPPLFGVPIPASCTRNGLNLFFWSNETEISPTLFFELHLAHLPTARKIRPLICGAESGTPLQFPIRPSNVKKKGGRGQSKGWAARSTGVGGNRFCRSRWGSWGCFSSCYIGVGIPQDAAAHIRSGHKGHSDSQHCSGAPRGPGGRDIDGASRGGPRETAGGGGGSEGTGEGSHTSSGAEC